jgi:hypothetical protein
VDPRSGAPVGSILLCKQSLYIFEEFAQVFFNDAPHNPVLHAVVAVCEDSPEHTIWRCSRLLSRTVGLSLLTRFSASPIISNFRSTPLRSSSSRA